MLDIKDLSFSYDYEAVINGLNLRIEKNGIYAIMGPSGCGKSTLFSLIAGLLRPDRGRIDTGGHRLGFCFQEPRLLPWMNAAENVNFILGGKKSGLGGALELLNSLGLEGSAFKYPDELSGGMQKRVALARSLANSPDLLLLDEPFSGLDEETKEIVIRIIKKYSDDAIVLWITHDPAEAEQYADAIFDFTKLNKK